MESVPYESKRPVHHFGVCVECSVRYSVQYCAQLSVQLSVQYIDQ